MGALILCLSTWLLLPLHAEQQAVLRLDVPAEIVLYQCWMRATDRAY
jgi:hypothetical protein